MREHTRHLSTMCTIAACVTTFTTMCAQIIVLHCGAHSLVLMWRLIHAELGQMMLCCSMDLLLVRLLHSL